MANAPVIFDDGGSTRIKQLKDNVNMDTLLGAPTGPAGAMEFKARADGRFLVSGAFGCTMKIRVHQNDGDQDVLPHAGVVGSGTGVDLLVTDQVVIASQNGQIATVSFDPVTFEMIILLTAGAAGITPIVEAKQNQLQRRYVVSNAGAISTVTLVRPGPPLPPGPTIPALFSLGNPPTSIYTMVHFR